MQVFVQLKLNLVDGENAVFVIFWCLFNAGAVLHAAGGGVGIDSHGAK